ncbi:CRISPR-associated helicase Cas3' [Nonomuraea sp. NPDC049028]|uniref:CRISPR-associated helicase Cas3' n=1 Tax=Nonomuraea sp. NPDC049028 TaxID=3364348 RepID=UPI003722656C
MTSTRPSRNAAQGPGFSASARALWGKTGEVRRDRKGAADEWHSLVAHMVDTMEVADELWHVYLSSAFHERLAEGIPGTEHERMQAARALFRWLAALHDLGKAGSFQGQSVRQSSRVQDVIALPVGPDIHPHSMVSAHLMYLFTAEAGWTARASTWVANVVGGHHGVYPRPGSVEVPLLIAQIGGTEWREVQRELFREMTRRSGVPLDLLADHVPPIGSQVVCSGAVILCDWLASNENLFPYTGPWSEEYPKQAARRVKQTRKTMQLEAVWHPVKVADAKEMYLQRFGIKVPRDTQLVAHQIASEIEHPGLVIVEAPTGEGKTEAALVIAEIVAARFGFNGLFFGLPTQATSNRIFDRVLDIWLSNLPQSPLPTVGLVHGKARQYERFDDLPLGGVGDFGSASATASQWMRGGKKALLSPISVGTIDQLLFAGVSAPHVMLRHLAIANKVVVIDEVHAYDAYMSRILYRVLHWLGLHRVPVVLLSATLPAEQRDALLRAYAGKIEIHASSAGYPQLTWTMAPGQSSRRERASFFSPAVEGDSAPPIAHTRSADKTESRDVSLKVVLHPEAGNDPASIVRWIPERGCVLVLRNTVPRAQQTYEELRKHVGEDEITLVHARFTSSDRTRLDDWLATAFGPPKVDKATGKVSENPARPTRHIVVATQVVEQSLDVDFDLLITDLAPIDLMLQRAGRLHRHQRPSPRPAEVTDPTMVVTGHQEVGDLPKFPTSDDRPYLHHFLLRTLAVLRRRDRISIPDDVPMLIEEVYGDQPIVPELWSEPMAVATARMRDTLAQLRREANSLLLAEPDPIAPDLSELQRGTSHEADEEVAGNRLRVRSGEPSVEVILLRRMDATTAATVSKGEQVTIPLDRTPTREQKKAVLGQAIRLPSRMVNEDRLESPPGWRNAPWCRRLRVLMLSKAAGTVRHGANSFTYSTETGWTISKAKSPASGPSFNLVDEPWLDYVTTTGVPARASLRELLVNAHTIRDLSVDVPTQYPVLIRLLLAVLHRALGMREGKQHESQPRIKGDWQYLYSLGRFPSEPISEYLDTWRDRLDLFHPEHPFFQAGHLTSMSGERKPAGLLIPYAASGNNVPIFSQSADQQTVELTPAEAARWLLHAHGWDTAGIKTGAFADPQAKQGKTTGNRTGLLGSLGVLVPTGTTLWETLMYNLLVLNEDISPADDIPVWEHTPLTAAWQIRLPYGVLDLYGWPGRRIHLFPAQSDGEVIVRQVLVCAGDRLKENTTLDSLEPHTAWYAVDDQASSARYRPSRHRPGQQLWRGLGGILGRRFEKGDGGRHSMAPHVLTHLRSVKLPMDKVLQLRAYGVVYGTQSSVVEETYTDVLPLPVALLRPAGKDGLDAMAVQSVEDSKRAADALGQLAADTVLCSGGDDDAQLAQRNSAQNRLYLLLDQPFREWIAGLRVDEAADLYREEWHNRVRAEARRIARSIVGDAPPTALRTRMRIPKKGGRPEPVNLALAHRRFEQVLSMLLPQSQARDDEAGPLVQRQENGGQE